MTTEPIGNYQVLETLGKGAASTIFLVRRAADAKHYALKSVPIAGAGDQKYLEQARHEFQVAQRFDHPHLLKIYAFETRRDWLLRVREARLLIEYVKGRTLDLCPNLSMAHLVQVFTRTAAGLAHMHRHEVCHADLKPNNILLSAAGEVKIIDFGLAWIKGQPKGRIQGTPEYMAPEQVRHALVNEQTDIFNLGACMYRMVTGRLPPNAAVDGAIPFDAGAWERLLPAVADCNPKVPPELADLIHHCLRFQPRQRPQCIKEVQERLNHLCADLIRSRDDRLEALQW